MVTIQGNIRFDGTELIACLQSNAPKSWSSHLNYSASPKNDYNDAYCAMDRSQWNGSWNTNSRCQGGWHWDSLFYNKAGGSRHCPRGLTCPERSIKLDSQSLSTVAPVIATEQTDKRGYLHKMPSTGTCPLANRCANRMAVAVHAMADAQRKVKGSDCIKTSESDLVASFAETGPALTNDGQVGTIGANGKWTEACMCLNDSPVGQLSCPLCNSSMCQVEAAGGVAMLKCVPKTDSQVSRFCCESGLYVKEVSPHSISSGGYNGYQCTYVMEDGDVPTYWGIKTYIDSFMSVTTHISNRSSPGWNPYVQSNKAMNIDALVKLCTRYLIQTTTECNALSKCPRLLSSDPLHQSVFALNFGQKEGILPQDWIKEIQEQVYDNVAKAWCAANPRHTLCQCVRRGDSTLFNQMVTSMGSNPVRCWYSPCTLGSKNTTGEHQNLVPSNLLSGGTCKTAKCQVMNQVFLNAKANNVNVNLSHIQNHLVCDGAEHPSLPPNHKAEENHEPPIAPPSEGHSGKHQQRSSTKKSWRSFMSDRIPVPGTKREVSRWQVVVFIIILGTVLYLILGEGGETEETQ